MHLEKIIELCGQHTLSVELLARTAQNAAMPLKDLYAVLETKGFDLNAVIGDKVHTFWHNEQDRKLFFDHLLTLFDLSNVTGEERHILVNLAVLPAIYIAVSDISDWLGLESKEAITSLVRKGWLKKSGFTIFMHQVIQEVTRYRYTPGVEKCKALITSLANRLSLEPGENPMDKKEYVIFADTLLKHIDDQDEELARLSNNLSTIYNALGQLEQALEFQKKALKIREAVLAKNHPSLATSYNNLSTIYKALGQLEQALEFQLKDVKISEEILSKNHPSLATSYNNLSTIYYTLQDYKKAIQYGQQAVAILQNLFPNGHPNLDTAKKNLELIKKEMK